MKFGRAAQRLHIAQPVLSSQVRAPEDEHSFHSPACCRVAGKAGFTDEGIRRAAALHADGWHDMDDIHVHARLNNDLPRD